MKTSTLIVSVALTASVLLLAFPKKGAVTGSSDGDEAPFVPKVRNPQEAASNAHSEQLAAQLLRLPQLDWQRDPFEPIELAPWPVEPPTPAPLPLPVQVEPEIEPVPAEEPPPTRTGPLPVLTGISQSGAHRFAIVDRTIVEEGDTLPSGDMVMGIGIRAVTLRSNGEIVVIRLGNGQ